MDITCSLHTCSYSKRYIADIKRWCYNPKVSSKGTNNISDIKRTTYCIPSSMNKKVDPFLIRIQQLYVTHMCKLIPLQISVSCVAIG